MGWREGKGFSAAGFKTRTPQLITRPSTPKSTRDALSALSQLNDSTAAGPAAWDSCRTNRMTPSMYSNVNRDADGGAGGRRRRATAAESHANASKVAMRRLVVYLSKSGQDVADSFARMDTDGSGELDEDEFRRALLEMGLAMGDHDLGLVMQELDVDGSGTVGIDELLDQLKKIDSRLGEGGEGTVVQTLNLIFDWLHETKSKVVDVFNKIDLDGNGVLDATEFRGAMDEMGLKLSAAEVDLVMADLDPDGNGEIETEEFLDCMKAIHRRRKAEKRRSEQARRESTMPAGAMQPHLAARARKAAAQHPALQNLSINFARRRADPGGGNGNQNPLQAHSASAQQLGRSRSSSPSRWAPPPSALPHVKVAFGSTYTLQPRRPQLLPPIETSLSFNGAHTSVRHRALSPDVSASRRESYSPGHEESWAHESLQRMRFYGSQDTRFNDSQQALAFCRGVEKRSQVMT